MSDAKLYPVSHETMSVLAAAAAGRITREEAEARLEAAALAEV